MPLPDLDKLRGQLLISGIQQTNQPLWQVINLLITYLKQLDTQTTASLAPGGGAAPFAAAFCPWGAGAWIVQPSHTTRVFRLIGS